MPATVVFRERVEIEDTVYEGEMETLEVAMEERWLHVRSDGDEERVHSFPLSMIACVARDQGDVSREASQFDLRKAAIGQ